MKWQELCILIKQKKTTGSRLGHPTQGFPLTTLPRDNQKENPKGKTKGQSTPANETLFCIELSIICFFNDLQQ
jgi:hypothetical protein